MLQSVSTPGYRGRAVAGDDLLECVDDRSDRGVPDDMKTGGDPGLGAGGQVFSDGHAVQVAGAGATAGSVGVRLAQPGGSRSQRPVDEEVTGESARAGGVDEGAGLRGGGHRLAPESDDFHAVGEFAQLLPVPRTPYLRAGAFVDRHYPGGGGRIQCSPAGGIALLPSEQAARLGADEVVGVSRQRQLRVIAGRGGQTGHQLPQTGGGQRRVHVDPGKVGRDQTDDRVDLVGGGYPGPAGVVPAMGPDRLSGAGGHILADQREEKLRAIGDREVQAG